jgi:uncharacterized membrane protein
MSEENAVPDAPEVPEAPDSPEVPEGPEISFDSEPTSDDKLWSALGYPIPIIALIALLMEDKKARPFIKYHAVQALAFNIVLWIIIFVVSVITLGVASICAPAIWLVTLWPAYDAYRSNYTEIPVISNFIKKQGWV